MEQNNATAQRLFESFMQFRKVHWHESPIACLKPSELVILGCLEQVLEPLSVGVKMSTISSALKLAMPTVTELVKGLVENGYVERNPDPDDRRVVRVCLTATGAAVIRQAKEAFLQSFTGLVDYLGEEKGNQLVDLLSGVFAYYDQVSRAEMKMDA